MLKPLVAVLLAVFCFSSAQAQTEWTSYYKDKLVNIDYRHADCNRPEDGMYKEEIFLRFTNLTTQTVTVTYQRALAYNDNELTVPAAENTFSLTLAPGETLEGKCGQKDKRFFIFVKMLDNTSKSILTDFKLLNIQASAL